MSTTTVMAEIAGRQRPIQYPLAILRRTLHLGAHYPWRALRVASRAIARERERDAYRRALQALNPRMLQDIGLHRSEIPWALNTLSTTGKLSRLSAWSVRD